MDSASEGTREASSRLNKPTWVIGLPKRERIGTWQSNHDQGSFPPNPVQSTVLRLRKTATRNEVTSRWLSVPNDGVGGQAACLSEERWGKKPMLSCNAPDMLTYPRYIGR